MLIQDMLNEMSDPFYDARIADEQMKELHPELLARLLGNSILEGAILLHREFFARDVSEEVLRAIVSSHPRLVFNHRSTSEELRFEILKSEELRNRLASSPFTGGRDFCEACVLEGTTGRWTRS